MRLDSRFTVFAGIVSPIIGFAISSHSVLSMYTGDNARESCHLQLLLLGFQIGRDWPSSQCNIGVVEASGSTEAFSILKRKAMTDRDIVALWKTNKALLCYSHSS